jgi:hypothetical protein
MIFRQCSLKGLKLLTRHRLEERHDHSHTPNELADGVGCEDPKIVHGTKDGAGVK